MLSLGFVSRAISAKRGRVYYDVKPYLPRSLRVSLRRALVRKQLQQSRNIWPIDPSAGETPDGWPGWPHGRKFAFVLTHDVEGQRGLDHCRALMETEMKLGFRSSFNFVPEGEYRVSAELRGELEHNGFEVGVHDLRHDGKLYRSAHEFAEHAQKINGYLKAWNAKGFRSAFMLHDLELLKELDVLYDSSTFDTDPFEPQPDGVRTIFPFWIQGPSGNGFVELPYSMAQDSTLFLYLKETSIEIWTQKLKWVVSHGGMAMLDTHPDYISFTGHEKWTYPVSRYEEFLKMVRTKYAGQYWHALPREVAKYAKPFVKHMAHTANAHPIKVMTRSKGPKPKIWIDLDNTPHIPFFEPIIDELRSRDYPLLITARDAFQVCELADKKGFNYVRVGRHYGRNRLMKASGLAFRAMQLAPLVLREQPALGVSHGARSQLLLGNWIGLPTILLEDYEYCWFPFMMKPSWVMAPSVIPTGSLGHSQDAIRKYNGIKEEVYAWKLKPDPGILNFLGLQSSQTIATVRPPATEAHYHNSHAEVLFEAFMERAQQAPEMRVVMLPRNKKQEEGLRNRWPAWFANGKTVVPSCAVDGMNLIWHSDLVVSGGGTMNREAAALGVPVYSVFRGSIGAVDRHLADNGRLVLIESVDDIKSRISFAKRPRKDLTEVTSKQALCDIVGAIEEIAVKHGRK